MAPAVSVYAGASTEVKAGGEAVVAIYGPALGGVIVNPLLAADQGIPSAENLYVDIVNTPGLAETATTIPVPPGGSYFAPANLAGDVRVNAATSGHRFSAIVYQPQTGADFQPYSGTFPPNAPTTLQDVIPSYLYQEYDDDEDLQAFVNSYNALAQEWVDWFNQINLPIYTGPLISGTLLDWVATNLYGQIRPTLLSGMQSVIGPLNTWALNTIALNERKLVGPIDVAATTDDIYKRILTWNFYKGDGRTFNIRWLKRRVMRFLLGTNGTAPPIPNTYQISVSLGLDGVVSITILTNIRTVTGGAIFNTFPLNGMANNVLETSAMSLPILPDAQVFVQAMNSGVLLLPDTLTYDVRIN